VFVLVIAAGILFGTVYGGFHYAVDSLAGLAVGIAFGWLGPRMHRALLAREESAGETPIALPARPQPELPPRGLRAVAAGGERFQRSVPSAARPSRRDHPAAEAEEAAMATTDAGERGDVPRR
jgi:membrane-associated phospholipid phosphatase